MDCRPLRTVLFFEELEPRLLYSADLAGVDPEILEQDYEEEPAVTADLETVSEATDIAADQSTEEQSSSPAEPPVVVDDGGAVAEPVTTQTAEAEEATAEVEDMTADTKGIETTEPAESQANDPAGKSPMTGESVVAAESGDTAAAAPSGGADEGKTVHEVIFVNDDVHEYQELVDDVLRQDDTRETTRVVVIDSRDGGIDQVTETLEQYQDLDAIHFIAHGNSGAMALGSDWLAGADLSANGQALAAWGEALGEDGDILLYGCDIAGDLDGRAFADSLARLTGADVAASDDPSGNGALGGDWQLEYATGRIDGSLAIGQGWHGLLAAGDTPPVITTPGAAVNYLENDPATIIDANATVSDIDSLNFFQGTLTVSISAGGEASDQLEIVEGGNVTLVGGDNNVMVGVNLIGHTSGGNDGTPLVITFTPQATPDLVQEMVRQIGFRSSSDDPSTAPRTVDFVLTDGDGGTSNIAQQTVAVITAVNDPPAVVANEPLGLNPGETATITAALLQAADPDNPADEVTYTMTVAPAEGSLQLNGTALAVSDTFTQADINAGLLRYVHSGVGSVDDGFTFTIADGVGGSVGPTVYTVAVNDSPVDPPVDPPVEDPVEEQKPIDSGSGGQKETGEQEEDPDAGDESGTVTAPFPPLSDPAVPPQAGSGTGDSGGIGLFPQVEPDSPQESRETASPADGGQEAGQTFFAAGNKSASDSAAAGPEGLVVPDKGAEENGLYLPEQPAALVGKAVGDADHEATISETLKTTIGHLLGFLAPSSATAALAVSPDAESVSSQGTPANNEIVCREVEVMRQEMEEAFLQSNRADKLMVYTTTGMSLSLAAGIARYFFQSGSLLTGVLATIPLWKGFDPVAVLRTPKNDRKKAGATSPSVGVQPIEQKAETMFAVGGDA